MKCPFCASSDTRVINSRPSEEGTSIRRRRDCENCHRRFTTYERAQFEALMVNKRSGRREAFNPDKLLDKLRIACNKRPATEKQLREFAYGFEDEVQVPEISSEEIGLRTLKFLKALDDVAYIRFLSVYRDFDSVDRFIEEIKELSVLERGERPEPEARGVGETRAEGDSEDAEEEQPEGSGEPEGPVRAEKPGQIKRRAPVQAESAGGAERDEPALAKSTGDAKRDEPAQPKTTVDTKHDEPAQPKSTGDAERVRAEQAQGPASGRRGGKARKDRSDESGGDASDTNRRSRTGGKPMAEQTPLIPPEALDPGDGSKN